MDHKLRLKDQLVIPSFDTNKPEIAFLLAKARFLFDDRVLGFLQLYNSKQKRHNLAQKQKEKIYQLVSEEDAGLFTAMAKYLKRES